MWTLFLMFLFAIFFLFLFAFVFLHIQTEIEKKETRTENAENGNICFDGMYLVDVVVVVALVAIKLQSSSWIGNRGKQKKKSNRKKLKTRHFIICLAERFYSACACIEEKWNFVKNCEPIKCSKWHSNDTRMCLLLLPFQMWGLEICIKACSILKLV